MTVRPVELVPAAEIAAEAIELWFADAWADMWGRAEPPAVETAAGWLRPRSDRERWIALIDDEAVGFVDCSNEARGLTMTALAVARQRRNLGIGSAIVEQLEGRARGGRALAYFPVENGYAFYFWLRAGYRPDYPADLVSRRPVSAVVRDLARSD